MNVERKSSFFSFFPVFSQWFLGHRLLCAFVLSEEGGDHRDKLFIVHVFLINLFFFFLIF